MPVANPDLILWIDTETTGLDPATDDLLEIAVVVTRNDLTEIGAFDIVIAPRVLTSTPPSGAWAHSCARCTPGTA